MYFDLFRNRWAALAFAGLIMVAAAAVVGSEDGGGLLDLAAEQPGAREAEFVETVAPPEGARSNESLPPEAPEFEKPAEAGIFTPDAELIDEAEGFDITPMIVHEGPDEDGVMLEAEGEALILPSDDEGPGS